MTERNNEVNNRFIKKVIEYMGFEDIIHYPFVFVEINIWE